MSKLGNWHIKAVRLLIPYTNAMIKTLTPVSDGESVGAGAGIDDGMSIEVGAEQGIRARDNGDDMHAVGDAERGIRVAPVGRHYPRRHWL